MFIFSDFISLNFTAIDLVDGGTPGLVGFVQASRHTKILEVLVQHASGCFTVGPVVQTLCQSVVSSTLQQQQQRVNGEATPTPETQGAAQRQIAHYSQHFLVSSNSAVSNLS